MPKQKKVGMLQEDPTHIPEVPLQGAMAVLTVVASA
ncbi:hypothetical protein BH18THE2_BH18THE2_42980 [soil metagenome]